MKIGILSIVSKDEGGVYQYTISLLKALSYIDNNYEFIQIRNTEFPKILKKDIEINVEKSNIFLKLRRALHGLTGIKLGNLLQPHLILSFSDIDLIVSPIISLLPFHAGKPYIVTIHDFQQEYYPEFFSFKERISRKIIYRTGKFANMVIVESNYVKQDVIKFLGISEEKIKVLPSPPPLSITDIKIEESKLKLIKDKYKLPNEYLFYPAQFWYHKNHIKLIESLKLIKDRYKTDIPLILTGSKKNNFENVMNKIKELKLENQIKYLGYVPYEDMPYLYKNATSLVMPTLFESVSIPIWEAFYFGVPVVSSNVCALPEQVGDAGLLFDPNDPKDMADKIYKVWTDKDLRKEMVKRGYDIIKDFTLENYAKQWENIIKSIIESNMGSML